MERNEQAWETLLKQDAAQLKAEIEAYLIKWWGERCQDYDANCVGCRKWKAMDTLLETW